LPLGVWRRGPSDWAYRVEVEGYGSIAGVGFESRNEALRAMQEAREDATARGVDSDRLREASLGDPDPEINAKIEAQALEGELADLAAGYAPKFWRCPDCGAGHQRGHFQTIGVHRCMGCGYVGTGGTMHTHVAERQLA
jgi:hypothetical protein